MSAKNAIILGATGAVGKSVLTELLSSSSPYDAVHAFVRRPFKAESTHKDNDKLVEHTLDFDKLVDANGEGGEALRDIKADAVFITLGTTRAKAGSAQAFERIDRSYVLASAKAALVANMQDQRIVYCSSAGSSSGSPLLYPKSKGLTEEGLAALGYADCIIFRPGFLTGAQRPDTRIVETIAGSVFTHVIGRVTDSANILVPSLAKAFVLAGVRGSAGLTSAGVGSPPSDKFARGSSGEGAPSGKVTIISNAEAKRLAKDIPS